MQRKLLKSKEGFEIPTKKDFDIMQRKLLKSMQKRL